MNPTPGSVCRSLSFWFVWKVVFIFFLNSLICCCIDFNCFKSCFTQKRLWGGKRASLALSSCSPLFPKASLVLSMVTPYFASVVWMWFFNLFFCWVSIICVCGIFWRFWILFGGIYIVGRVFVCCSWFSLEQSSLSVLFTEANIIFVFFVWISRGIIPADSISSTIQYQLPIVSTAISVPGFQADRNSVIAPWQWLIRPVLRTLPVCSSTDAKVYRLWLLNVIYFILLCCNC